MGPNISEKFVPGGTNFRGVQIKRDRYGHCVRLSVKKVGGSGGMLPQRIRHSEIASEAMFGPKKLLESPHL